MSTREWQLAEQFFENSIPSALHDEFLTHLSEFRGRKGRFGSAFRQKRSSSSDRFWNYAQQYAPLLAELAVRLLSTPANSVPAERSFSSFNSYAPLN
ncbi:hypothetical protein AUEXF2481DRAFT_35954 [Aureobasidium subglaciale EXF-2481]|uniref:HAT C-terminal dimerisation domain-containing protein n=1 Tax=Aureobasidium subglaciale (strain EXF-2481) TaxID=1043005 RepID=A0A074YV38_AURSE|nr:uncharacterized protein AUEXF2481DRAFT_35954 [Aureobasidium subglaciale EXF-2481]KER00025.1 hypothetical protein AUEXF2481DRAFT_35954 [Aureobasidium subglaciale EXF-2481]